MTVHTFMNRIIRLKKKENWTSSSSSKVDNLLSWFVMNEDYSEELLQDIIINFLLARREMTLSALSCFF